MFDKGVFTLSASVTYAGDFYAVTLVQSTNILEAGGNMPGGTPTKLDPLLVGCIMLVAGVRLLTMRELFDMTNFEVDPDDHTLVNRPGIDLVQLHSTFGVTPYLNCFACSRF